jgi:hypothetical protein
VDDHGNLSPDEQKSKSLLELLELLELVAPEESRRAALERGLPELALNLLIERADSDDPTVREDARAALADLGLELAHPDGDLKVPEIE